MKKKLYDLVQEQARKYDQFEKVKDGQTWNYHISQVIKNSLMLGKIYGADLEVLEIAALFHDYANLVDFPKYNKIHHIASGELAEPILKHAGYKQDFIDKVKQVIKNHRGSVVLDKSTIEEKILADADAMTHIDNVFEIIMWLGYRGDSIEDANIFVKNKIKKSFAKMSPKSQELVKDRYEAILKILY